LNIVNQHVFINGFMGAGKSRVAPLVASALNCPLFDTDKIIEYRTAKSVNEIFSHQGEAVFREMELMLIRELTAGVPAVISLGGGTLTTPAVRKIVRSSGITVYLRSAPEDIYKRVKHRDRRPLLRTERDADFEENLMEKIHRLLTERKEIYEDADIIIERDGLEAEAVAGLILNRLQTD